VITCTVHEPPNAPADRLDRAESLVFVRDGFNWIAAALTPLWALANRMWWVLIGYLVVLAAAELGFRAVGIHNTGAAAVLMAALHLLVGLEASSLMRWTLRRKGYAFLGSVNGRNGEDCERRFFDAWLPSVPVIQHAALAGAGGGGYSGHTAVPVTRPMPISERPRDADGAPRRGWWSGGWRTVR
jgi:hypothetical protein